MQKQDRAGKRGDPHFEYIEGISLSGTTITRLVPKEGMWPEKILFSDIRIR